MGESIQRPPFSRTSTAIQRVALIKPVLVFQVRETTAYKLLLTERCRILTKNQKKSMEENSSAQSRHKNQFKVNQKGNVHR